MAAQLQTQTGLGQKGNAGAGLGSQKPATAKPADSRIADVEQVKGARFVISKHDGKDNRSEGPLAVNPRNVSGNANTDRHLSQEEVL